jgi:prolyl-tRNA synthetase
VIGEYFAKWISSYRDLPLLINQWANVVRWELRPRLFLRTTEFLWQEGHTAHATAEDAIAETEVAADIYTDVAENVARLPVLVGEKTPGERFAGAVKTVALEAMMRDGRALQSATSHFLGTNFSEAFDITFTGTSGVVEHAWTTSWGMSSRLIGGVIMAHGDDRGLVLPPKLAPVQAIIVPIGRDAELAAVLAAAQTLASQMRAVGVRVRVDERDHLSPGRKFNEWELKGVPLRIEIGPRDLAASTVTVVDRLSGAKEPAPIGTIAEEIPERLDAFERALFRRALDFRAQHTTSVVDWDGLVAAVSTGFARMFHCGTAACEDRIKRETSATARVIPRDEPIAHGTCAACGEPSGYDRQVIFARAY